MLPALPALLAGPGGTRACSGARRPDGSRRWSASSRSARTCSRSSSRRWPASPGGCWARWRGLCRTGAIRTHRHGTGQPGGAGKVRAAGRGGQGRRLGASRRRRAAGAAGAEGRSACGRDRLPPRGSRRASRAGRGGRGAAAPVRGSVPRDRRGGGRTTGRRALAGARRGRPFAGTVLKNIWCRQSSVTDRARARGAAQLP